MLRHVADKVLGSRVLHWGEHEIDLDKPFRHISYDQALEEFAGISHSDEAAVRAKAEVGLDPKDFATYDRLANEVRRWWSSRTWSSQPLLRPADLADALAHPRQPRAHPRFELFLCRMELGNAYSELNDPTCNASVSKSNWMRPPPPTTRVADGSSPGSAPPWITACPTAAARASASTAGDALHRRRNIDVILFPTMRHDA